MRVLDRGLDLTLGARVSMKGSTSCYQAFTVSRDSKVLGMVYSDDAKERGDVR